MPDNQLAHDDASGLTFWRNNEVWVILGSRPKNRAALCIAKMGTVDLGASHYFHVPTPPVRIDIDPDNLPRHEGREWMARSNVYELWAASLIEVEQPSFIKNAARNEPLAALAEHILIPALKRIQDGLRSASGPTYGDRDEAKLALGYYGQFKIDLREWPNHPKRLYDRILERRIDGLIHELKNLRYEAQPYLLGGRLGFVLEKQTVFWSFEDGHWTGRLLDGQNPSTAYKVTVEIDPDAQTKELAFAIASLTIAIANLAASQQ